MTQHRPPDPYQAGGGDPEPAEPTPSHGEIAAPAAPTPSARRRSSRRSVVLAAVGLVVALAVWGWFASANARETWWDAGNHVAITPDDSGWATVGPVQLRLSEVDTDPAVEAQPPAGLVYLALTFEVTSSIEDATVLCDVEVLDSQGRLFEAGRETSGQGDDYEAYLTCGTSDPVDDPVPPDQSVLVLLPADAVPVSARVDSPELPAASFVEFPLG